MTTRAVGPELANIPWEERPAGSSEVVWRYRGNPVLMREAVPHANSIFNSAGDTFYSESPDMVHWGCHRHVMSPVGGSPPRSAPGPCP